MLGNSSPIWERLEESRLPSVAAYFSAAAVLVATGLDTGFAGRQLTAYEIVIVLFVAVPAVFLLFVALTDLMCYFIFIPSISRDGHLFSAVHGSHLIHPLTTSLVLGLAGLCIFTGSSAAWAMWAVLCVIFVVHTGLILRKARKDHLVNGLNGDRAGTFFLALNLILGTDIVTMAAGAKPLAPWRLDTLPEDTWIIDVRTKPEFHWNRLQGAESFPWGAGVVEAANDKPKDRPVLVTCLSGHRSPTVAVMLRKAGFKTVYNLNFGLLYLILLERGRKKEGPFALTRPHRDPHRRGEDLKGISIGYVTLQALILIIAPLENGLRHIAVSSAQQIVGAVLGLAGLTVAIMSYRALGRNFRVFAAPRRSGTLVTTGIYSRVRHPMYTAVIVMFSGYIIYFGSLISLPLWLAFSTLYVIKAVKEERIITDRFPEYEEYRKRTGRFLPFL